MVLVLVVASLAVAVSVARGRGMAAQGAPRIRAVRLLVAAAVVQVGTSLLFAGSGLARGLALVLTTLLVGLVLAANGRLPGVPLIGLGLLLNVMVVMANGAMPVSISAAARAGLARADLHLGSDAVHEPAGRGTRLRRLGDVVPVALPWRPQVVSPGDVLVAAGVLLLLVSRRSGRGGRWSWTATPPPPDRTRRPSPDAAAPAP